MISAGTCPRLLWNRWQPHGYVLAFLRVGTRAWLLGLWSQLLPQQPCRKVADARWCVAGQGSPPARKNALGLRAFTQISEGEHRTSFLSFPICWGHQDMQSSLTSRLNTLEMQLTGILWRTHHTGSYLCLPTVQKEKAKEEAILWSCRVLGAAWGKV